MEKKPTYEELKRKVKELEKEAAEHKTTEEVMRNQAHDLGKRVKELDCLYGIFRLIEKPGISLEEILQGTVNLIPPAWQYPEITCTRITLDGKEFGTENFRETAWKQIQDIRAYGERIGTLEVYYLEERPKRDEGPFLKEERNLLTVIAELLGRVTWRMRAEEKIEHLNLVLRAIRNVNQLITREKDRDRLLKGICDSLIETRGYYNAWIALLDENRELVTTAEGGWGKDFLPLIERMKRGDLPDCSQKALSQSEVVITEAPPCSCADCPLTDKCAEKGAVTIRLEYGGKIYGLLSASILRGFIADEEGHSLFQEVAGDIAFALHSIELEEERKQMEEALRETRDYLENLINYANAPIIVWDPDSRITRFNHAFEHLSGFRADEVIGQELHMLFPEPSRDESLGKIARTLGGEHWESVEIPIICKDGDTRLVLWNSANIYAEDGTSLLATVAQGIEITGRKQAEEALRDSEEKYRSLVESTEDSIYLLDRDCRYLFMNQRHLSRFGTPTDKVIGRAYGEFHSKEETKEFSDKVKQVLETGKSLWYEYRSEKGGGYFLRTLSPVKEPDGRTTSVTVVSKNISELKIAEEEKKKLEAQFQAAQRMEAMGTLAGGIAHDFNNILMGIQGNASLVVLNKTSEHSDYERLKGIEQGVQSGAELTRQLLGFARGGKYEVRPSNLNELIENQNRMFGRTKKEITIRGKYEESLWTVEVDQGQIGQVLLNLYVNAWQAMPAGGDLYIETENVTLDENYTKPYAFEPGRYVKISITDTGVGMDEATQQRIFDPFFTTKEMGRGTGLGLASVYGIIKNHGGIINVYSEKGGGSTFTIYLSASKKKVVEDKEVLGEILKGSEGILLVDDEDMIIDVGVGILRELGYKVLLARGGKEAIEIYKKNKDNIDMVILDMIMPGVGGGETYDRMKEINPGIKVLLSSGYSINGQATEILERGCDGFIQKPFDMRALSQEVRKILDG